MSVKTTININKKVMEQINCASEKSGISRCEIIVRLLMKVMSHDTEEVASGSVKYQEQDAPEMWRKFHICLKDDEYNYFLDLRKILKKSVSLLVAFAVKKYLNEMIYGKKSDNFHFKNYFVAKELVNGVICWKICWGNPVYRE